MFLGAAALGGGDSVGNVEVIVVVEFGLWDELLTFDGSQYFSL